MYEDQPIELFWDSSSVLDTATAGILRGGGFSARPISLSQLSDRQMSEETGPRVVCVQGFSGMQEAHIKNVREFTSAGGIGIHHTSTSNTLSELKKLGFK